jgi:acetyltransferase-like isoleucine patch superfamily enzyme
LIFKRVVIKDDVIIGAHSLILPGTIIEPNTILDSNSITKINQHLDSNSIYRGRPVKKVLETRAITNKEAIGKNIFEKDTSITQTEAFLTAQGTSLSVPFQFYIISGTIIIGFSFLLPGFIFYFFLFGFLAPGLLSQPLTPLIIISCYLLHLFFVALFTRWFYKLADKRGPSQGVFDRNLDESSTTLDYYHFRSFLMKYPVFAFSRSPFPWLVNWELNFIKSNKIGKGTVLEETFIHSHINLGDNCYLGTSSHITNHLVDGVYGAENLIFVGVEIGNKSILNSITGGLPGTEIGEGSTFLPGCTTIKYDKLDGDGIYHGFPAKRMKKEEIIDYLGGDYSGE